MTCAFDRSKLAGFQAAYVVLQRPRKRRLSSFSLLLSAFGIQPFPLFSRGGGYFDVPTPGTACYRFAEAIIGYLRTVGAFTGALAEPVPRESAPFGPPLEFDPCSRYLRTWPGPIVSAHSGRGPYPSAKIPCRQTIPSSSPRSKGLTESTSSAKVIITNQSAVFVVGWQSSLRSTVEGFRVLMVLLVVSRRWRRRTPWEIQRSLSSAQEAPLTSSSSSLWSSLLASSWSW